MKKLAPFVLFFVAALGLARASAAKPYHYTRVSWIVATRDDLSEDDRYVTIIGHVTRRIGDEHYWFADNTGSVRLDSENFDLPIGPRIVIGGRIDQAYLGFGHIEVDVRRWHYAPRVPAKPVTRAANSMQTAPPATSPHDNAPSTTTAASSASSTTSNPPPMQMTNPTTAAATVPTSAGMSTNTLAPPTETITNGQPQTAK